MNWYTRLRLWFMAPAIDALRKIHEHDLRQILGLLEEQTNINISHMSKLDRAIRALPNHSESLQSVDVLLHSIWSEIKESQWGMPRLTIGMLMAWEAISYSVDKFAKDIELKGQIDRKAEILMWTRVYLNENHWPVPVEEELLLLLALRDQVNDIRLVGKFN